MNRFQLIVYDSFGRVLHREIVEATDKPEAELMVDGVISKRFADDEAYGSYILQEC